MSTAPFQVRQATVNEAPIVIDLVQRLLTELGGFQTDEQAALLTLCTQLLENRHYTAFLAYNPTGDPVGVLTLQEVPALYIAGYLGWIQELYVAPSARSASVGQQLLAAARTYGQERGWKRLEVNTPNIDAWPRTVAFYHREGFQGGSSHMRLPLV